MFYGSPAQRTHFAALIWSMVVSSDQILFYMYHYNSYANNSVMLRSSKPLVMRDVFLTKCTSVIPNPLSCIYVSDASDALINIASSYLIVYPLANIIGVRHAAAVYFGSGFLSSFAYVFAAQTSTTKVNTEYDCCCTSNGAFAGCALLTLMLPRCYIPTSKQVHVAFISAPYIARCAYNEYVQPYMNRSSREPGAIELRNWGLVGGLFFAMMYSTLLLRTKVDFSLMRQLYANLNVKQRGRASH